VGPEQRWLAPCPHPRLPTQAAAHRGPAPPALHSARATKRLRRPRRRRWRACARGWWGTRTRRARRWVPGRAPGVCVVDSRAHHVNVWGGQQAEGAAVGAGTVIVFVCVCVCVAVCVSHMLLSSLSAGCGAAGRGRCHHLPHHYAARVSHMLLSSLIAGCCAGRAARCRARVGAGRGLGRPPA